MKGLFIPNESELWLKEQYHELPSRGHTGTLAIRMYAGLVNTEQEKVQPGVCTVIL